MAFDKLPSGYLEVGTAVRPHGVHGEICVDPLTDTPGHWKSVSEAAYFENGEFQTRKVVSCRIHQGQAVILLEGINDRNAAELFRGRSMFCRRELLLPLIRGRYFIAELEGCRVECEDGTLVGVVDEIMQPGANDVYVLKSPKGEILLPAIPQLVIDVLPEERRIRVRRAVLDEVAVYED